MSDLMNFSSDQHLKLQTFENIKFPLTLSSFYVQVVWTDNPQTSTEKDTEH